jgi:Family of unknown function (DUF6214)
VLEASFLDLSDRNAADGAVSVWPAWKVREHDGTTTSWFQVRLAFPDGAHVDALAVLRDGRVSIEDVSAQPALSLADLTVLADWIEGPLFESCGVAAERPQGAGGDRQPQERHEPEADSKAYVPVAEEREYAPVADEAEYAPVADGTRYAPVADGAPQEPVADGIPQEPVADGTERAPVADGIPREPVAEGKDHEPEAADEEVTALRCAGPRRARSVWPRGSEGRRLVALEYRAAQEQGSDPVLAVMSATGHSRRRSLRLIAQARDAGYLTPRHIRRD